MAPGPVRWPSIASSVPSETFPTRVRFRGWMSEAGGFLCLRMPCEPSVVRGTRLPGPVPPAPRHIPQRDAGRHRRGGGGDADRVHPAAVVPAAKLGGAYLPRLRAACTARRAKQMIRTPATISLGPQALRERAAPAWSPSAPAGVRGGAGGPKLAATTALIAASRAAAGLSRLRADPLVTVCATAPIPPAPADAASTAPSAGAAPADTAASIAAAQAAMRIQAVRRQRPTAPRRTITSLRTIAGETESIHPSAACVCSAAALRTSPKAQPARTIGGVMRAVVHGRYGSPEPVRAAGGLRPRA